ncbi:hypothetical protein ES703_104834 [subsurface metagenome]
MNTFPVISRKPGYIFSDEPSTKAVLVADMASGYPLLNKLFTFAPRLFSFDLPRVPEADKLLIMTFYEANKDIPFLWYNSQDKTQYEVIFVSKPGCGIDGQKDRWRITLNLLQSSP